MIRFTLFALVALMLSLSSAHAKLYTPEYIVDNLSNEQVYLLKMAFHIGNEFGISQTLQSILMQETLAGKLGRVNRGEQKVAYGITQVRPLTAKDEIERYLRLGGKVDGSTVAGYEFKFKKPTTKDEYIKALTNDDLFALYASAITLKENMRRTKNWKRALVAYYEGVSGARRLKPSQINDHFYFKNVLDKAAVVGLFNKRYGLIKQDS